MLRWIWRGCLALLGVCLLAAVAGTIWQRQVSARDVVATPPPGTLVDIGGHRLHLWCVGAGEPTVILESGLGGNAFDWSFVQPEAARFTKICTYDRAGAGYSDPGPGPRRTGQLARELSTLLDRAGIQGPVILAGQSFGGLPIRLLASARPEQVAGLIFVDASHENQDARFEEAGVSSGQLPWFAPYLVRAAAVTGAARAAAFGVGPRPDRASATVRGFVYATRFRTSAIRATADEFASLPQSIEDMHTSRRPLNIPIMVLSRTRGRETPAGRAWEHVQEDLVGLSSRACQAHVPDAGHLIHVDQPAAVVAAIVEMAAAVHESRAPRCTAVVAP